MRSTIALGRRVMKCFARAQFGKKMVIVYCNVTLMYMNLYGIKGLDRTYEEEVVSVSQREFQMLAVHISNDVRDSDEKSHTLGQFLLGSIPFS